jgi:hypothetical protein
LRKGPGGTLHEQLSIAHPIPAQRDGSRDCDRRVSPFSRRFRNRITNARLHLWIVQRVIKVMGPLGARIVQEDTRGVALMKVLLPSDFTPTSTESLR